MRIVLLSLVLALLPSCRDIQPFQTVSQIRGYQLSGTITSQNGIPLDSVSVRVYYEYDLVGYDPVDTQRVIVTDSTKIVDVAVYTPQFVFVKQLFFNYLHTGPVPNFFWDQRDQQGASVKSGEYLIRYAIDTQIVKYSVVVIDGHISATTDALGHFILGADRLPVGIVFDAYTTDNMYDATLRVRPVLDLILLKGALQSEYPNVQLNLNQITTAGFTLG